MEEMHLPNHQDDEHRWQFRSLESTLRQLGIGIHKDQEVGRGKDLGFLLDREGQEDLEMGKGDEGSLALDKGGMGGDYHLI